MASVSTRGDSDTGGGGSTAGGGLAACKESCVRTRTWVQVVLGIDVVTHVVDSCRYTCHNSIFRFTTLTFAALHVCCKCELYGHRGSLSLGVDDMLQLL